MSGNPKCKSFAMGVLLLGAVAVVALGADYKPIVLDPNYDHDKWGTKPTDYVKEFRAYTVSFDTADDDDGDGDADCWAIPEWVAHEIKGMDDPPTSAPKWEESTWITEESLNDDDVAPKDNSYLHSGYNRGHMCQKLISFRLGADADWNTHTVLNACPQLGDLNSGYWLDLEKKTAKWADVYGAVWVVCGPVFLSSTPMRWIGDDYEVPVAIPDAFFKIVVKEVDGSDVPDVLAFIYAHQPYSRKKPFYHENFLVSVDLIELLTGLDFLTALPDDVEAEVEASAAGELWE